jgi:N utilization substance protein B
MGIRRAGRIIVLQSLYQMEIAKKSFEEIIDFIENYPVMKFSEEEPKEDFLDKSKEFAADLVKTVVDNMAPVDEIIPKYLKNWKFDKILAIDRNILRMGVAELLFREDIPYKVTINESIELAKKFGDEKSGSFVNGVLDNIVKNETVNFEVLNKKTSAKK